VNVRFINKINEVVTLTLSVTDTQCQHTSLELRTLLEKILKDLEIPLNHVLCCVTDNAANMLKVVKDMNKELNNAAAASGLGR